MTTDEASRSSRTHDSTPGATDAELIRTSLTEPERFGEVYHRHASAVHGFAVARVGPEGADDVTAETFIAAFRNRHRFDLGVPSARPWLMGIAVRQIAHRRRAERARYRMLASLAPSPPEDGLAEQVAEVVAAQALRRPLAEALSRLRARDRDVLLLLVWADLTYQETAEALGLPIGTVRSRLHRARQVLRAALAENSTKEEASWTS